MWTELANVIKFKVILVCQIIDIPQTCLFEYSYLFLRVCERVVLSLLKPDAPASFPRFPPSSLSSSLAAPHFLYYRGRQRRRRRRIRRERRNLVSKLPFGGAAASDGRTESPARSNLSPLTQTAMATGGLGQKERMGEGSQERQLMLCNEASGAQMGCRSMFGREGRGDLIGLRQKK